MALPKCKYHKPLRPNFLLQTVVRLASLPDLWSTNFKYTTHGMEKVEDQAGLTLHLLHAMGGVFKVGTPPAPICSFRAIS